MSWFRLEDSFYDNPKVRQAGNAAIGLWVRCATYSARYLTDGYIDVEIARQYGSRREIDRLLTTGLWTQNGAGFVMPDYLDYNPSATDVRKRRAETSANKRRGGLARAQAANRDEHGHFLPANDEPW